MFWLVKRAYKIYAKSFPKGCARNCLFKHVANDLSISYPTLLKSRFYMNSSLFDFFLPLKRVVGLPLFPSSEP